MKQTKKRKKSPSLESARMKLRIKIPRQSRTELDQLLHEDKEMPSKKQLEKQNKGFMHEARRMQNLLTTLKTMTGLPRKKLKKRR